MPSVTEMQTSMAQQWAEATGVSFEEALASMETLPHFQSHMEQLARSSASSGASVALGASFLCLIGELSRPLRPAGQNNPHPSLPLPFAHAFALPLVPLEMNCVD